MPADSAEPAAMELARLAAERAGTLRDCEVAEWRQRRTCDAESLGCDVYVQVGVRAQARIGIVLRHCRALRDEEPHTGAPQGRDDLRERSVNGQRLGGD